MREIGSIALESLFLVTLMRSTIRAREAAVQDSENSVYKMHEKDSENSETSANKLRGWEMEDRRWKMGGGFGQNSRFLDGFLRVRALETPPLRRSAGPPALVPA